MLRQQNEMALPKPSLYRIHFSISIRKIVKSFYFLPNRDDARKLTGLLYGSFDVSCSMWAIPVDVNAWSSM